MAQGQDHKLVAVRYLGMVSARLDGTQHPCKAPHVPLSHHYCRYMQVAGRSEASNSWQTYVDNYFAAFRTVLNYTTSVGTNFTSVVFKARMLGR
jgi:hypothetical protein